MMDVKRKKLRPLGQWKRRCLFYKILARVPGCSGLFYGKLTQARVILGEKNSTERVPLPY